MRKNMDFLWDSLTVYYSIKIDSYILLRSLRFHFSTYFWCVIFYIQLYAFSHRFKKIILITRYFRVQRDGIYDNMKYYSMIRDARAQSVTCFSSFHYFNFPPKPCMTEVLKSLCYFVITFISVKKFHIQLLNEPARKLQLH